MRYIKVVYKRGNKGDIGVNREKGVDYGSVSGI
jgi:hypothetical protein